MTDKKTIEQLNKLKSITPDSSWKEENRRVLFSQVSNSYADVYHPSIWERVRSLSNDFTHMLSKPVWAVVIAALLIGAGGIAAQPAYNSRPGDTFYFAKKLTQKVRLALVFDKKEKARMNIRFSSNHAKDITDVLSSTQFSDQKMAQELEDNFKEELDSVRSDLRSITEDGSNEESEAEPAKEETRKPEQPQEQATISNTEEGAAQEAEPAEGSGEGQEPEGEQNTEEQQENDNIDDRVFGVDFGKDGEGKDIYIPEKEEDATTGQQQEEDIATTNVQEQIEDANQKLEQEKENVDDSTLSELDALLDQAGAKFEQGEYAQVRELLNQFSEKVNNIGSESEEEQPDGEVKGVSEEATSTEEEATSSNATTSSQGDSQEQ